jgi:hypothetical protein
VINSVPWLDMNNRAPGDCQIRVWVLRPSNTVEIISQIEVRVNPQVSLTQSHEGYVQDPQRGQLV